MKPILTVGIPTYNRAKLLVQQLESIEIALEFIDKDDIEFVFIDNCSTDETQSVLLDFNRKHSSYNITIVRNEVNIGVTRNILKIPTFAKGKFCWLLGDDDIVFNNSLKNIIYLLKTEINVNGLVVSHLILPDNKRVRNVQSYNDLSDNLNLNYPSLFGNRTGKEIVENIGFVFQYTQISAPLNFLSNVVFDTYLFSSHVEYYDNYCSKSAEFSDSVSTAAYLYIWIDIYYDRPLLLVMDTQIIGFVGNQKILGKWPYLMYSHYLFMALHLAKRNILSKNILKYTKSFFVDVEPFIIVFRTNKQLVNQLIREFYPNSLDFNFLKKVFKRLRFSEKLTFTLLVALQRKVGFKIVKTILKNGIIEIYKKNIQIKIY